MPLVPVPPPSASPPEPVPHPPRFDGPTLRLTVSGHDKPGLTSGLFELLARGGVTVLDVGQVVLGGHLVLGVLVTAPKDARALTARLQTWGEGHDVRVDLALGHGVETRPGPRCHVTVLSAPLGPAAVAALAGRVADLGGNIDRIQRVARWPITALELDVSGVDPATLKTVLAVEAQRAGVDVAVHAAGLQRRAMRLVVLDVDSTLIQGEVIEMLAEAAGCAAEVAAVTASAMAGDLDFARSLVHRVALLAGLDASVLGDVRRSITLTPGARSLIGTLRRLGYHVGLVSGGFGEVVRPIARDLDVDFVRANGLEVREGRLTGRLAGPILDRAGKAAALREFAADRGVPLSHTVAIGDGANDLDMLATAGLGIAFNAKPMVRAAADAAVTVPYLDSVLALLGIDPEELDDDTGPASGRDLQLGDKLHGRRDAPRHSPA